MKRLLYSYKGASPSGVITAGITVSAIIIFLSLNLFPKNSGFLLLSISTGILLLKIFTDGYYILNLSYACKGGFYPLRLWVSALFLIEVLTLILVFYTLSNISLAALFIAINLLISIVRSAIMGRLISKLETDENGRSNPIYNLLLFSMSFYTIWTFKERIDRINIQD